jgi:DNA invertase Pin-like site-specific DNA recombinase
MSDEQVGDGPLRAVQYVRMSTEHQRYSLVNQKAAIAEYASKRGYEIVGTYADAGKSGLSLKGREALKQLLSDALSPTRSFDAILVLDISRWGRFQDPDQAAHYEFICRQAGLKLAYCAEAFENDNSPPASILKHLKRIMAAEYSRELSVKLSRAHLQQASLGFNQGGGLLYGFRRELRDQHGNARCLLEVGQEKALNTDHVVVVPGPAEEQRVIRRIFHMYVRRNLSLAAIALQLRSEGISSSRGQPWTPMRVHAILASEFCIGRYTYNRTTQKLQGSKRRNPEFLWVGASTMKPLIPEKLFREAQKRLSVRRGERLSDKSMLQSLRRLLKEEGRLSHMLVNRSKLTPSATTYRNHFGSLPNAFKLIGYEQPLWRHLGPTCRTWTDEALAEALRRSHAKYGYLSNRTIDRDPDLPSAQLIKRRFESLSRARQCAGLPDMTQSELVLAAHQRQRIRENENPLSRRLRANGTLVTPRFSSETLIEGLQDLLKSQGYLSAKLIDAEPRMPCAAAIARRFGSLLKAYELAGWKRTRKQILVETYQRRDSNYR